MRKIEKKGETMSMNSPKALARVWACIIVLLATTAQANEFAISPILSGAKHDTYSWNVSVDGTPPIRGQTVYLARGQTYTFTVTGLAGIHSFYINTQDSIGSANAYTGAGLSENGVTAASGIHFDVPLNAPERLYYNCGNHASMGGVIEMVIFRNSFDQ
jgi:hypothetical protein